MWEAVKVRFLDTPISQVGLFGNTVEEFAQLFSMVKKQTEAIKHILPRCGSGPGPVPPSQQPLSARRWGQPSARTAEAPQQLGPAAKPDQRPTTSSKVAPPDHCQGTRNPHKA